jgi:protein gp37
MDRHGDPEPYQSQTEKLDWVICGGETGPGARPIQREWVADLRDQCVDANVPFFFKKWGPHSHKKETGIILDDAIRNTIDGVEWRQWPEELA